MVDIETLETVLTAKKEFKNGNFEEALKAWNKLYDKFEKLEKKKGYCNKEVLNNYHQTMALFSNDEVFGITDYGKQKEYKKMGY